MKSVSLSHGGLYTESELKSWRSHLESVGYSTALMKKISYGICLHTGECQTSPESGDFLGYNLDKLEQKIVSKLNPFDEARKWIIEYAAYISTFVIFIETAKVIFAVVAMVASLNFNGLHGAKLVCLSLCCSSYLKYTKISEESIQRRLQLAEEQIELGQMNQNN